MTSNSSLDEGAGEDDANGLSSVLMSFLAVGLSFNMVLSLALNGLLCLVFQKRPVLVNASNSFVLNLAICQLGISVLVLPLSIVSIISQQWLLSENWCRFQGFLFTVFVVTSMLCLAVISIDRHYAITNSLRYPYVFTQFRCNFIIAMGWLTGVSLALPPLIYTDLYGYEMVQFRCGVRWSHSDYETAYLAVVVAICYVLPMCIMLWCYCSIFAAAIKHTRAACRVHPSANSFPERVNHSTTDVVADTTSSRTTPSCQQQQKVAGRFKLNNGRLDCKATRTIMVILVTYFVCWVPYVAVCITHLSGNCVPDALETISVFFLYSSTSVNPIVYGFMNRTIRDELVKYICQGVRRDDFHDSDDSRSQTLTTSTTSGRKSRRCTGIWTITTHHPRRLNLKSSVQSSCMERITEESDRTAMPWSSADPKHGLV